MRDKSRTERNKREVRGRIVAAARELFDERGIEATKVETICDQADIALRTFFNHFPSKRDVVHQLAVDATAEVLRREAGSSHRRKPPDFPGQRTRLLLLYQNARKQVGSARNSWPRNLIENLWLAV